MKRSSTRPLPTRDEVAREKARRKLRAFAEAAWPILEPPSRRFQANWHMGLHLDDIAAGKTQVADQ